MIHFKKLKIPDLLLIEPQIFSDERGFFFESYNQKDFEAAVGKKITFVQDNHSYSTQGVLRGLHAQKYPYEQGKLVRVVQGEIFDVAVDIRQDSNTYGQWVAEFLSSENKKQLWIPEGFAHGFLVVSKSAEVLYKTTNYYNKSSEICIKFDDPKINIMWPKFDFDFIVSDKDRDAINI